MSQDKKPVLNSMEGIFTAISFGFFILILGILFISTPDLYGNITDFFGDIGIEEVSNSGVFLPAPEDPRSHLALYNVMGLVSIAGVVFQAIMLILRFVIPSTWTKRSETMGNFVYWIGVAFLVQWFLIDSTQWFVFWSCIIMAAGVSLIARAGVMAFSKI
ncbi:MAG: hypothetical protein IAX21_08445 [Candidatus Bathyarchaeota archaeon]|nr:MAG: hypothetical protein NUK63_09275 [Candidatus Bathyarchaeum tardum]WNZ28676.1 MAG: hypothetical protein IAX21_08445 [Candidatus Bathyarchaeota archaeon]